MQPTSRKLHTSQGTRSVELIIHVWFAMFTCRPGAIIWQSYQSSVVASALGLGCCTPVYSMCLPLHRTTLMLPGSSCTCL